MKKKISHDIVEQLLRPTGLLDPTIETRPTKNQMNNLIHEIIARVKKNERVLITVLTKRMAEDLAEFLSKKEIKVRYMHAEIENLQRTEIIRQLRLGEFDVLVGINLLREGLDIPEVSLVAILDADKEGFLRNFKSLIQTFGRAARNSNGTVIMYADSMTKSMKSAIEETRRRRDRQIEYNKKHNITPQTIIKSIPEQQIAIDDSKMMSIHDISKEIIELEILMKKYSKELDFESAMECRDKIKRLEKEVKIRHGK